jgi:hypothetical protein
MANINNPRGFEPVAPILRMQEYTKGTATAMYPGDIVSLATDGKVYVRATGNATLAGVVMSYRTAANTRVLLADHPDQQYYLKDDGVGGTLAAANIGNGANLVMTAGNATFLKSAVALDTSTVSGTTSATLQVKILGFHPDDEVGKYVRCRVRVNPLAHIQERATYV